MRALKPLSSLLLAAALALVLGSSAHAQRRVLAPPGTKPASEKADEDAAESAAKAAVAKARAKAAEVPAAAPKILELKDEQAGGANRATAAAPAAPAPDVIYRKKADRNVITLRVRPAQPAPFKATTLQFEILRILPTPDPTYGDRLPLMNAQMFATVTEMVPNGQVTRFRLHPLKDAGSYGTNVTVPHVGLYKIELAQQMDEEHLGEGGPVKAEFTLGIGRPTPMAVVEDSEDEANVEARRGRQALKAKSATTSDNATAMLMRQLGERWMDLAAALDRAAAPAEREAIAREIVDLAARAQGTVPSSMAVSQKEYDALAAGLQDAVKDLPTVVADAKDTKAAREQLAHVENESCLRCHVQYRFHVTDNLSTWPRFTPRAPDASAP